MFHAGSFRCVCVCVRGFYMVDMFFTWLTCVLHGLHVFFHVSFFACCCLVFSHGSNCLVSWLLIVLSARGLQRFLAWSDLTMVFLCCISGTISIVFVMLVFWWSYRAVWWFSLGSEFFYCNFLAGPDCFEGRSLMNSTALHNCLLRLSAMLNIIWRFHFPKSKQIEKIWLLLVNSERSMTRTF